MRMAIRWFLTVLLLLPASAPALEAPRTLHAEYRITYFGLRVASASFVSTFAGDRFRVDGSFRSAGVARLFDQTEATTHVTGRFFGDSLRPSEYVLNYVHGGKQKKTAIRYGRNGIESTERHPAPRPPGRDWVPLGPDDLAAALDPVSGTLLRAASPRDVCNRTIRAYDGEFRVDLPLSFAGMQSYSTRGFKGEVVRCVAAFVPVSGYRKGRRALEFLQRKPRIEIAFAPVGDTGVHAPIAATVETEIGPVKLNATLFSVDG